MGRKELYNQIIELSEAKDFIRVINKWDVLSGKIGLQKDKPIVLPDLFWIAKPGVGKTHLLRLLSDYLYECGSLMEFHGNVRFFEFMLDYYPPAQSFPEIHRMINEVNNAAGFRNIYKGIISIDIDEWIGHCEEKHFIDFLEYLSSNSDDWLIVFNITADDDNSVKQLESLLSMYFRLERSILNLPDTNELLEFVSKRLVTYNLVLDNESKQLLFNTINKLRQNKYFDGYKTLIMLCKDIVYELFSNSEFLSNNVTADSLKRFDCDSDYIKRATWKAENKRKIGLIEEKRA